MTNVLVIGPTPPPFHGVATFIRDLLEAAPRNAGFQFDHLDTSDRRDASNLGRWDVDNLSLGFASLAQMASRLVRKRYDLVYVPISQNVPAFLRDALFIIQSRLLGARVVLQLHGGYFREFYDKESPAWFRAIARFVLNRAHAVIVLSEDFRHIFDGLVPATRIHVIENGVPDLFENAPALHPTTNAASATPQTILYLSTLTETKGILDLLQATAIVRSERPHTRLRVAGNWTDQNLRDRAIELIACENLNDCVEFVGNVDGAAKREFLLSGDVFCLPTRYPYEGQPLAVLEAMSAGLPVLSMCHGALPATVLDGITGRLLDRNAAPRELAAALNDLLAHPQQLRSMGEAARQRFLDRYTLSHCHEHLLQVFETALE